MNADYSWCIVMLSRQRSGTNALQSVLETHPAIFCTREIFHDKPSDFQHLNGERNYFRFLEGYQKTTLIKARTSDEVQEKLFTDYLHFLRETSGKTCVVLDIKYNSSHHFNGPWQALGSEPQLFRFIRRHGLRLLHLTRSNYLRYFISRQMAIDTGQWVTMKGSEQPDLPRCVLLPVEKLLNSFNACRFEDELVVRSFDRYGGYMRLDYDELFPQLDGGVSEECLGRLATWLGLDNRFPQKQPLYSKLSPRRLPEALVNLEEVVTTLRGTVYEYCLEDESMYRD